MGSYTARRAFVINFQNSIRKNWMPVKVRACSVVRRRSWFEVFVNLAGQHENAINAIRIMKISMRQGATVVCPVRPCGAPAVVREKN